MRRVHRLVLVPILVGVGVTLIRVTGEVQGWIATTSGGALHPLGVTWLVLVFGAWFGYRLGSEGAVERPARALGFGLLALGIVLAALAGASALFAGTFVGIAVSAMLAASVAALLPRRAAPVLFAANVAFALPVRIVIILVTTVSVLAGWGTHYEKMGPENALVETTKLGTIVGYAFFHLLFWVPVSAILGSITGGVGAWIARRRALAPVA